MCHPKRLLIPAIAVVFLALTLVPAIRVADAQASEDFTTLLQPGLNMVGWTHAETGVDALFADIPELEAVYAGTRTPSTSPSPTGTWNEARPAT